MPVKCDICGVETKVEEAFYRVLDQRSGLASRRRCPACWQKRRSKSARNTFISYSCVAAIGLVCLVNEQTHPVGWIILNVVLFYLSMAAAAVPHEFGHIFAAKMVGFRPFYVVIGYGRVLYERPFCGFTFQLKSIPFGGFAFSTPKTSRLFRLKKCIMIVAGPLANLCLATGLLVFFPHATRGCVFYDRLNFPCVFFVANVACFGYSLLPHTLQSSYGTMANDGLLFWKTLFLKKEARESAPFIYYLYEGAECFKHKRLQEAGEWYEKGLDLFPENERLLDARGIILSYQGHFSEAREVFLKLLARPKLHDFYRCQYANCLAWLDTLIGGDELIKEADRYSQEALESMPHMPHFKGTRGNVLVELGHIEEGVKLLKEAMTAVDHPISKAMDSCHIAIAERRRGNLKESNQYAEIARSLDPDCILLDRLAPPVSTQGPPAAKSSAANT